MLLTKKQAKELREGLKRGAIARIAELAPMNRTYLSNVLSGRISASNDVIEKFSTAKKIVLKEQAEAEAKRQSRLNAIIAGQKVTAAA